MKRHKSNDSQMIKELSGFTFTIGLVVLAYVVIPKVPPAAQAIVLRDLLTLLGIALCALYQDRR